MAFYWLNVKIFSRGRGSCVTRAAAYRAGERIRDERTRITYDYSSREDVIHKEIVLPSRSSESAAMEWARDRATLWNSVERTDRRNARLARQVLVVLPAELTPAQRVQLTRRLGQELADRYLGAVDVAVHLPRPTSVEINHHAHLLMTPREVIPEGFGSRTILELSGKELRAAGLGPSRNELLFLREHWARIANEALHEAGLDVRIDHRRSQPQREIYMAPTLWIPHKVVLEERVTGAPSKAGEAMRADMRERMEARLKGPDELARVVARHMEQARERAAERARQKAARPKGIWSSVHTAEERYRMVSELYRNSPALRERRRLYNKKYYEENRAVLREKARAKQLLAKLAPEREAAERWWKGREKEKERGIVKEQVRKRARERIRAGRLANRKDRGRESVLTAQASSRNGSASRERQKEFERSRKGAQLRAHERAPGKSGNERSEEGLDRQKQVDRNHDHDYGL